MSLNKRMCLRSDSQNRDSFDERICDDLSEVILQFLPLKDKLRLECVSKQFSRTVFIKQREIDSKSELFLNNDFSLKSVVKQLKIFELIVKKFQNINKIEFSSRFLKFDENTDHYNEAIDILIKNCNNLTHFDVYFNWISNENQKLFLNKFGSKIILSETYIFNLSKSFFDSNNVDLLHLQSPFPQVTDLQLNRLERLDINYLEEKDLDQLEVFVERNKTLIKHLFIDSFESKDKQKCKQLLRIVSKLPNLVHLTLECRNNCLNDNSLDNEWKQIAINCSKLKSFNYGLLIDPKVPGHINDNLLSSLKQFKSLKRLIIDFSDFYDEVNEESYQLINDYIKWFSFKAFKGFKSLTHLAIGWPTDYENGSIDETILTDIDINLPNLQFLRLQTNKMNASEWTADILSRLLKLHAIQLYIEESDQPLIRTKLENCNKIKNIEFNRNWVDWYVGLGQDNHFY